MKDFENIISPYLLVIKKSAKRCRGEAPDSVGAINKVRRCVLACFDRWLSLFKIYIARNSIINSQQVLESWPKESSS